MIQYPYQHQLRRTSAGNGENVNLKKIVIHSETVYLLAIVIMSLGVAVTAAADFGLSMIAAPAYILHLKLGFLTFGQSEYVIQAVLFLLTCILLKKVKPLYFTSFLTCLIYGAVLDLWRLIPAFNPNATAPGSMGMGLRVLYFVAGMLLCSLGVALFFRTYLYPQVYELFVKAVSEKYRKNTDRFKIAYDLCSLAVSVAMTLLFFGAFRGIGIGTLVTAALNGIIIGLLGKLIDRSTDIRPRFPKLAKHFDF